ncbi:apolipoprotein N-acyltransferase [Novosphingobium colocasiae]|uniref:apolipoprotein N-acyltransferase n=1 Tax=Novosphingobium colocasiae TaxID=1256513 RepID=UPI0016787125|nr:apolipoprotein N-acyltransferase [Novosphingobium colocasiae]
MPSDRSAPLSPPSPAIRRVIAWLLPIVAGVLAACGFQPLALWPLTLIGMACLAWLAMRAGGARSAFLTGWLFGLGLFTLSDNWIATAFTYQAQMPVWLGGIAVGLLSLYLAIFPGLASLGLWLIVRPAPGTPPALAAVPAFAGLWIVSEWLRAWLFTGFAWNPIGVALLGPFRHPGLAALTPWIGTYGLSGLLVLLAAAAAWAAGHAAAARSAPVRLAGALGALLPLALAALGMVALRPPAEQAEGGIAYTLVQPDLRQEVIDDPRRFEPNFQTLARLSPPLRPGQKRLVLWPESGLADYLRDGYPSEYYYQFTYAADPGLARRRIGHTIGDYGLLLSGGVDLVMADGKVRGARNSVTAFDGRGDILASYSKAHLVPYGEYLPMRGLLEPLGLSRLVAGALDFWPGPGPRTYDLGDYGKAGVQICYEIVFSGEVVDPKARPDYIFNPSNDGWFGAWGPPQHLAQARLRAIEEGLPVLRSTTTGISAVIDADGVVRAFAPWHHRSRLDGFIPPAHEATAFARIGNALPLTLAAALILLAFFMVALHRRRR